jgi:hypothetical protein
MTCLSWSPEENSTPTTRSRLGKGPSPMLKRLLVVALAAFALLTATAGAGEYPPADDGIVVDDPTVSDGQTVNVTAQCFEAGSTVDFSVDGSSIGTAVASADGVATLAYTVPPGSGNIVVTATGTGCDGEPLVLGATLTRQAVGGGALPVTGSNSSMPMARIAVSLLAVGALMVFAARWRNHRTANLGA